MDKAKLVARLRREEGFRPRVYDDATGKELKSGSVLVGNPTIGWGTNLSAGLTLDEAELLFQNRIALSASGVTTLLPFTSTLDDVRFRVFVELAFNDGLHGLLGFVKMNTAAKVGDWKTAAAELLDSVAARGLPVRYGELAKMLETGLDTN